jgi:hypothetical protein
VSKAEKDGTVRSGSDTPVFDQVAAEHGEPPLRYRPRTLEEIKASVTSLPRHELTER